MDERGITLLEVILTTVILGLLASVATFGMQHYLTYGKKKIAEADLATLKAAVKLYVLDHNQTLPSNPAVDLQPYLSEWPVDPFSKATPHENYVITIREEPATAVKKVYLGSRGPNGTVDYGEGTNADDLFYYVK